MKLGPVFPWRKHGVAQAPSEDELPEAAKWAITVPQANMAHLSELFLEIKYQGDIARLYANHRLLTDDFYNGRTWSIGLATDSFMNSENERWQFRIAHTLPLRRDAPIYFELPSLPTDFSGESAD